MFMAPTENKSMEFEHNTKLNSNSNLFNTTASFTTEGNSTPFFSNSDSPFTTSTSTFSSIHTTKNITTTFKSSEGPRFHHSIWGNVRALDFSIDGKYLATTEETSILRLFHTSKYSYEKDGIQITHEQLGDPYALVCHKSFFVLGSKNNVLQFSLPEGQFQKIITRHTLDVKAIALSPDGRFVASGSDDHTLRWTDAEDPQSMIELKYHEAPVSSLTVDPLGHFLTSVAQDGKLCHWDIQESKLMFTHEVGKKSKGARTLDAPVVQWSPNGKYMATNGPGNEIILFQRKQNTIYAKLTGHSKSVTGLAWSTHPNSTSSSTTSSTLHFLASTSLDKTLIVWNIETQSKLMQHTFSFIPTHVRWQPFQPHLAIALDRPSLLIMKWNDVDRSLSHSLHHWDALENPSTFNTLSSTSSSSLLLDNVDKSVDLQMYKKNQWNVKNFMDMEAHVDEKEREELNDDAMELEEEGNASDLDDFIVDDENEDKSRKEKKIEFKAKLRKAGFFETTPMQPAFQPGATPINSEKYYLAFNVHGVIYAVQRDINTSYHIERHDRSRHKPIQFTDARDFHLASLSNIAAAFACAPENDLVGSVHVRILDPWSTQSHWSSLLPSQEQPLGVAVGGETIVVITNAVIRIYSLGGFASHVISYSGIFVSMCAQDHLGFFVAHSAAPFHGHQHLSYTLLDLTTSQFVREGRVVLTSHSTLTWLGLSDGLIPFTLDSKHQLRGLSNQGHWIPLLTTTQLETDPNFHFFAVGIMDSTFLCLVSKQPYPGFPRPALSEYPCDFPALTNASNLEKQYHTYLFFKPPHTAIKAKEKVLLQLLQSSCQDGAYQKVLDIAKLLTLSVSFSKAIEIALFYNMPGLAEKIKTIQSQREQEEQDRESVVPVYSSHSLPSTNTNLFVSSSSSSSFPTSSSFSSSVLSHSSDISTNISPPSQSTSSTFTLPSLSSELSKRPTTSIEFSLPSKKAKFNPFLKKPSNPFLEKTPIVSIHHPSIEASSSNSSMKQASLTQFVKLQKPGLESHELQEQEISTEAPTDAMES